MNQDLDMTDAGTVSNETRAQAKERIKRTHADTFWTLRNRLILITTLTSVAGLLVSAISIYVAVSALDKSTKTQLALKDAESRQLHEFKERDLRLYFLKRYDELAYEAKFKLTNQVEGRVYYTRFWHLQLEEYQYWCDGMIDQVVYEGWIDSRKFEWRKNEGLKGVNKSWRGPDYAYQEAWKDTAVTLREHDSDERGNYTAFVEFMNDVFDPTKKIKISKDRCPKRRQP